MHEEIRYEYYTNVSLSLLADRLIDPDINHYMCNRFRTSTKEKNARDGTVIL